MSGLGDTLKNLGPARLAILGATFFGLIVFFIFVSAQVSQPTMTVLYSDLTAADSGDISAKLQESGVKFTVSPDGSRVFVPSTEIGKARMLLAEAGLPNGGSMGYELFDQQSGFGTTSFVQNINQVRALQGELARTISSLDPVLSANVFVDLPQRALFSRESREAKASVKLKLTGTGRLNKRQIYGIQNLVANAVPGLSAKRVTIIDSDANLLASGDSEDGADSMNARSEDMLRAFEGRVKSDVENLVGRIVGLHRVNVVVRADLDFNRISTNDEIYNPEGQVARSTQTISEDNIERDASIDKDVTVENNLPGLGGGDVAGGAKPSVQTNRVEEVTNFEISKTIRSTIRESGEVQKLSVSVLVDGRYTTNEEGERIYEPRTQEELDQIASLVRSAIGYDEKRGDTLEVVNMPFAKIELLGDEGVSQLLFGFQKTEVMDMAKMLMLVVMGVLVILLVLRPLVTSLISSQRAAIDKMKEEAALLSAQSTPMALSGPDSEMSGGSSEGVSGMAMPDMDGSPQEDSMIDMQAVEGKVKASSVKKVGDIVSSHPNETVSVLRNWMTQE